MFKAIPEPSLFGQRTYNSAYVGFGAATLAAYTINGAMAMGQQDITGSLEVGKRADIILIETDIEKLSQDIMTIWDIPATQVILMLLDGQIVRNKM